MITPSFGLTATERVLPKLALDFTTASLDSRVTFTRTTNATNPATYTNSSGNVTVATNNQPRFDYDPVALTCKGLLIEESRANLVLQSEDIGTTWIQNASPTITLNATTSPAGTLTADLVEASIISSGVFQTVTVSNATAYTLSYYIKAAPGSTDPIVRIGFGGNVVQYNTSTFATIPGGIFTTTTVQDVGNGWRRVTMTGTTATTSYNVLIYGASSGSKFYVWGAQLEVGAFATSYIPTTTTALTRNADVATMTGTNFSSWWSATIGSVSAWVISKAITGINAIIQFDDTTLANQICLRGNVANPELYIKATTDQAQIDAGTIVVNTAYKLTGAWNTNNCAASQNGATAVTDGSATIPSVTQARIGSDGTTYANAWIQKIMYWPQRITNDEVQAFSK